jgi:AraC-like DNA-binding protein
VNLKGLDKHYLEDILWTQEHIKESSKDTETAVLACAIDLVGAAMTASSTSFLADIVSTAPDALKQLMVAVKKDPTGNWSLRDAAAYAGYSPFHLSRTFRTVVDFGFPEYVDRCRAEFAIDRLLKTDLSIDEVASSCGFGSTQALREAFKEYLGMLPSEIRSIPVDEYQGR